jgi:hypothetical protein
MVAGVCPTDVATVTANLTGRMQGEMHFRRAPGLTGFPHPIQSLFVAHHI